MKNVLAVTVIIGIAIFMAGCTMQNSERPFAAYARDEEGDEPRQEAEPPPRLERPRPPARLPSLREAGEASGAREEEEDGDAHTPASDAARSAAARLAAGSPPMVR